MESQATQRKQKKLITFYSEMIRAHSPETSKPEIRILRPTVISPACTALNPNKSIAEDDDDRPSIECSRNYEEFDESFSSTSSFESLYDIPLTRRHDFNQTFFSSDSSDSSLLEHDFDYSFNNWENSSSSDESELDFFDYLDMFAPSTASYEGEVPPKAKILQNHSLTTYAPPEADTDSRIMYNTHDRRESHRESGPNHPDSLSVSSGYISGSTSHSTFPRVRISTTEPLLADSQFAHNADPYHRSNREYLI